MDFATLGWDLATLEGYVGKTCEITGIASDSYKDPICLEVARGCVLVHFENLESWPSAVLGKKVRIVGVFDLTPAVYLNGRRVHRPRARLLYSRIEEVSDAARSAAATKEVELGPLEE